MQVNGRSLGQNTCGGFRNSTHRLLCDLAVRPSVTLVSAIPAIVLESYKKGSRDRVYSEFAYITVTCSPTPMLVVKSQIKHVTETGSLVCEKQSDWIMIWYTSSHHAAAHTAAGTRVRNNTMVGKSNAA